MYYHPSLLKAPLLMVASYCCHVNATSPTPPAKAEEKFEKKYGIRDLLAIPVRLMLHSFEMLYHIIGFLELLDLVINMRYRLWSESLSVSRDGQEILGLPVAFVIGMILLAIGTLVRVSCYRALGRFFTFELSLKSQHTLVTDGPYAYVRHPAYTGSLMALAGCVLTHMGPGSWWQDTDMWRTTVGKTVGGIFLANGCYMLFFLLARTVKEDAVLRAEFKGQWDSWAARTRYRVIPFVY